MKIGLNLYPDSKHLPLKTLGEAILDSRNLTFAKQLGVTHIVAWMPLPAGEGYWEFKDLLKLKKFINSYGLELEAIENIPPVHWDRILFDLPGKNKQIENIKKTITNMGRAKIKFLGICFSIVGYWGHRQISDTNRGKAKISRFDYNLVKDAPPISRGQLWEIWKTEYYDASQPIETISREKMWERLCFLLDRILPVAQEAGLKICLHPSDPPAPKLRGEERIMNCPQDFKQLIELYPYDHLGIEFCQGTFAEMRGVGPKVIELIKYFGKRNKIFYVHFRNIRGNFPVYEEAFIDSGDIDMGLAFRAYQDVGFEGVLVPDHVPLVTSSPEPWHIGMAHSIGYIKSLMDMNR